MAPRRIRPLIAVAIAIGGIKIARDLAIARNRERAPEILDGLPAAAASGH